MSLALAGAALGLLPGAFPGPSPGAHLGALAGRATPARAEPAPPQEAAPWTARVAPASPEAERALAGLVLAPGLRAELWAAEPLLANPVCLALALEGARGSVAYVAETFRHHEGVTDVREHMAWKADDLAAASVAERVALLERWLQQDFASYARASERVRLVRDRDGDGRADDASVFAEGFDAPEAGIGAGLLARGADLYYACIPDLWRLRDADGDGRADGRVRLSSGYGVHIALLGHDLHGLRLGPDGRLWFSVGDRGLRVETPDGRVLDSPDCGAVLACELDGSGLEIVHSGLRNPQELAFDERGDLFSGDNNSDGGDQARLVRVVRGADSGWRTYTQWLEEPWTRGPWNEESLWKPAFPGQAAYLLPPIANHAAGPSGLAYHPGTGFDPALVDHFALVDFRGGPRWSGIDAFQLVPRGASYALGEVRELVRGALPTDCEFGFDGALWYCDWVEGWEKTGKGRIVRVLFDGPADPRAAEVAELLRGGLERLGAHAQARLLAHPDQRVRLEAELALAARGPEGERWLEAVALGSLEVGDARLARLARVHALWGLGVAARRSPPLGDALLPLCADDEPELRAQALHVLGELRHAPARRALLAGLDDPEPRARFFAALGVGRMGAGEALERLVALVASTGEGDRDLRHALIEGLVGAARLEELGALLAHESADVRVAAVVALRRRAQRLPGSRVLSADAPRCAELLVGALADGEERVLVEAARALADLPLAGAMPALAQLAPRLGADPRLASVAATRRVLAACERLGGDAHARALAQVALRSALEPRLRAEALAILADWGRELPLERLLGRYAPRPAQDARVCAQLADTLGPALADEAEAPERVLAAWIALARAAHAGATTLARLVADEARPSALRVAALEAQAALTVEDTGEGHSAELAATLDRALAQRDGALRAAALRALERLAPADARARALRLAEEGELAERRAAFALLARDPAPQAARRLARALAALDAGELPGELALELEAAARARAELGAPAAQDGAQDGAQDARDEEQAALLAALSAHEARPALSGPLEPYAAALLGGDAARGEALFRGRAELACARCHALGAEDEARAAIGPSLRGVGARLGRSELLESVVLPNRRIAHGFESEAFVLGDEAERPLVVGRAVAEDAQRVVVLTAEGERVELERAQLLARRPDLSAMPAGLAQLVSLAELRDLIEFLARQ